MNDSYGNLLIPVEEMGSDADNILDQADEDDSDSLPQAGYEITSYGVDFDVAGIVQRLRNGDVTMPGWQREFVWPVRTASRFIESLLLGLPVPVIFLGTDPEASQLYVIDGQQRLKTLQGFYERKFPGSGGKFRLRGVSSRFDGMTYYDLYYGDQRALDESIIRATVVRQHAPAGDDTTMYQIFSRLNSGGVRVNPHEIRCAVYQGSLLQNVSELNRHQGWREIVGKESRRLKDQELILRFMALWHTGHNYVKPMSEFLNLFAQNNRNPDESWMNDTASVFRQTVDAFAESKGKDAFRTRSGRVVNAAVFDSMAVGLASRISDTGPPQSAGVRSVHDQLISRQDYLEAVTQATSDSKSVAKRLGIATDAFANA